jgi:hypothetical protein
MGCREADARRLHAGVTDRVWRERKLESSKASRLAAE